MRGMLGLQETVSSWHSRASPAAHRKASELLITSRSTWKSLGKPSVRSKKLSAPEGCRSGGSLLQRLARISIEERVCIGSGIHPLGIILMRSPGLSRSGRPRVAATPLMKTSIDAVAAKPTCRRRDAHWSHASVAMVKRRPSTVRVSTSTGTLFATHCGSASTHAKAVLGWGFTGVKCSNVSESSMSRALAGLSPASTSEAGKSTSTRTAAKNNRLRVRRVNGKVDKSNFDSHRAITVYVLSIRIRSPHKPSVPFLSPRMAERRLNPTGWNNADGEDTSSTDNTMGWACEVRVNSQDKSSRQLDRQVSCESFGERFPCGQDLHKDSQTGLATINKDRNVATWRRTTSRGRRRTRHRSKDSQRFPPRVGKRLREAAIQRFHEPHLGRGTMRALSHSGPGDTRVGSGAGDEMRSPHPTRQPRACLLLKALIRKDGASEVGIVQVCVERDTPDRRTADRTKF